MTDSSAEHWNDVYSGPGGDSVSWFQEIPERSLAILDESGVDPFKSVVDIGAGASRLVDELLQRGFRDLTVVDISSTALELTRARVGPGGHGVRWVVCDVLNWAPDRTFDVWHDRAVFHFLTAREQIQRYLEVVNGVVDPGGMVVIGTFAHDGPTHCSGLPVSRYRAEELTEVFGSRYERMAAWREEHRTPGGALQPFTWVAMRHRANG